MTVTRILGESISKKKPTYTHYY